MSFNIKVDGKTVHEVDIDPRLVTGVSLRSPAGEAGVAGSPFTGEGNDWVNLVVVTQQPTALPVVEDNARIKAQEEGPEEVLTYNENAQRQAALEEVNAEYAEKSAESDEDLSAERTQAEADAMNPEKRDESVTSSEPAGSPGTETVDPSTGEPVEPGTTEPGTTEEPGVTGPGTEPGTEPETQTGTVTQTETTGQTQEQSTSTETPDLTLS